MKCAVYKLNELENYKYAVTFARYENKWLVCKHKDRSTWETSGGHIENGETPLEAAKRELYEETGAADFDMIPVCDYRAWDEDDGAGNDAGENGQVFFAAVRKIGELPESEMECARLFESFPQNLTYPEITAALMPYVSLMIYQA